MKQTEYSDLGKSVNFTKYLNIENHLKSLKHIGHTITKINFKLN